MGNIFLTTFIGSVIGVGIVIHLFCFVLTRLSEKGIKGSKADRVSIASINDGEQKKTTPEEDIITAAESGDLEKVKSLLYGNDQLLFIKDREDLTLLHKAAVSGNKELVMFFLLKGLFVNAEDAILRTPLHWAASNGQTEILELLIANDGNVNARNENGETPLHNAAGAGDEASAKLLVDKGADVDVETKVGSLTPWEIAWAAGHKNLAKLMHIKSSKKKKFHGME